MSAKCPVAVVFIHGLARKPAPEQLFELWQWGLSRGNPMPSVFAPPNEGIDLATEGVPHVLNYYADVFYGAEYETDMSSYMEGCVDLELQAEGLDRVEEDLPLPTPKTPREAAFLEGFQAEIMVNLKVENAAPTASPLVSSSDHEIARFIPPQVRNAIIKKAAMEAYYYLFNKEYVRPTDGKRFHVREELRSRLVRDLIEMQERAEKIIIVSHSMGTMIAYDVIRNCPDCPSIDTLITLGSPLGIREVQQELLAVGSENVDFPAATLRSWVNIYDPLDPICGAGPRFAKDYIPVDGKVVQDIRESNWGKWRHTITHYLAGTQLRAKLAEALEL
ncbi:PGAP1-like protein [Pseudomonas syringae pv. atrofaciens]|uniref:GPI inositol-deacylase PGAP1-like alpha/beta domain-containing protein n=1 Tax=Pseudomonas syringae pv. atrofaciens TaxID=192087 RepID=A0AAD0IAC1_PSESX|nr:MULTISPECIES: hypothetical protein [Pseudomonas syringae group]AVX25257.1 hypothetical protein DA456_18615 [Pseudomonas syringae pv. atrofaciens]KPW08222.1 PGAP1-like protein [Pseudomonas syringae pv. atrofaciens]PCK90141.1 hypothetical protein PsyrCH409_20460 [Pseudomonas viridiflava]RMP26936.1 PGAP1-like protein [Pseudomonas coronafaciens pv. atropurpurea]